MFEVEVEVEVLNSSKVSMFRQTAMGTANEYRGKFIA